MVSNGEKLVYFLTGGFIGASVALLLTPKSGEETRDAIETKTRKGIDKLKEKVCQGKETVEDKGREIADRASHALGKSKKSFERRKDQLGVALDAGRQAYENERDHLEESVDNSDK